MTKLWTGRGPRGIPGFGLAASDFGPWDDGFTGTSLASKWILRNITPVTEAAVANGKVTLTINGQGDAMYLQPTAGNIGSATDCDVYMRCSANNVPGRMAGVYLLDSSGDGVGYSPYNDGNTYLWNVVGYNYSSTSNANGNQPVPTGDYWLHLRKRGSSITGRWANHDATRNYLQQNYGSFTSALTKTNAFDRVGFDAGWTTGSGTIAIEEFRYRKA